MPRIKFDRKKGARAKHLAYWKVGLIQGEECWTDHHLVRAKFKFFLKLKFKGSGSSLPKRLYALALKDNGTRLRLEAKLEAIDCDNSWDALRSSIYDVSVEIIGSKTTTHKDWTDENNREIQLMLDDKRKPLNYLLGGNGTRL